MNADGAAESGACDGFVVFATNAMLAALARFKSLAVSRMTIAEIVDPLTSDACKRVAICGRGPANVDTRLKLALTALPECGDDEDSDFPADALIYASAGRH